MTGAPTRRAASICAVSGSMKSDTRTPAAASALQASSRRAFLGADIQAALGGHFLARFRYQTTILRPHIPGDADHLRGDGHLEIHARLQEPAQHRHVSILDVAPVLAQVQGDAVGARLLGEQRGVHRIGIIDAPCLAQRRDMIDVYTEGNAGRHAHGCSGGESRGRPAAPGGAWPA